MLASRKSIRAAAHLSSRRWASATSRVRLLYHERHTRPGGTVSGAAMFMLADFAVYVAIIAAMGDVGLDAVTTNLNINFLARPKPRDLMARVRLIRIGRRLAVGEARSISDGAPDMVAHAIATYALPARPSSESCCEVIDYHIRIWLISLRLFRPSRWLARLT